MHRRPKAALHWYRVFDCYVNCAQSDRTKPFKTPVWHLSTTWEVFADDMRRLCSPGHAGVDQDVILQPQFRQPLARELGLLSTWKWRNNSSHDKCQKWSRNLWVEWVLLSDWFSRLPFGDITGNKDLTEWGSSPCRWLRSGCTGSVWWGGCCAWLWVCHCPARSWGLLLQFPSSCRWTVQTGLSWTQVQTRLSWDYKWLCLTWLSWRVETRVNTSVIWDYEQVHTDRTSQVLMVKPQIRYTSQT